MKARIIQCFHKKVNIYLTGKLILTRKKGQNKMAVYNPKSLHAEEFINHEEILETLKYADKNKHNEALIREILEEGPPEKERERDEVRRALTPRGVGAFSVRHT